MIVEVRSVSKRFVTRLAVDDVSIDVPPETCFGLLGPNGAGKTTTMRIVTGILKPTSGTILVDGLDITTDTLKTTSLTGYIPDHPFLY